jgi:SAM-dependent methyltransferase
MDANDWNTRYAESDRVWSDDPNGALVRHAPTPGGGRLALDLGCGEGADALWLARAGWQVIGVDWAGVALDRARAAAASTGATASFVEGDITDAAGLASLSPSGRFDLITVAYVHPEPEQRATVYRHLPGLVAPDGYLLVIAHDPEHGARGLPGPQAHRLMSTDDILAALDLPADFEVMVRDIWRRGSSADVHALDSVVLAHRLG